MAVGPVNTCESGELVYAHIPCAKCGAKMNESCRGENAISTRLRERLYATRYEWLRNSGGWVCHSNPDKMDAEIDEAIAATRRQESAT